MKSIMILGLVLWVVGTVLIRLAGQQILGTQSAARTIILYTVSFLLMGLLARRIFRSAGLGEDSWPRAATLLALPT